MVDTITKPALWKVVRYDSKLSSSADIFAALEASGISIGRWARELIEQFPSAVAEPNKKIKLATVWVRPFDECNDWRQQDVYARARSLGLRLCNPWIGPLLRLQYRMQTMADQRIFVGMEPLRTSCGLTVFSVERDRPSLRLRSHNGDPLSYVRNGQRWVFEI